MPMPSRWCLAIALLLSAPVFAEQPCSGVTACDQAQALRMNDKQKGRFMQSAFERSVDEADARFDARDDARAARLYDRIVGAREFATLRADRQHDVLVRALVLAWEQERPRRALALARRAFALRPDAPDDLNRLAIALMETERPADAAALVIALAKRDPAALSHLDPILIPRLRLALGDDAPRRVAFLQALLDAGWDDATEDSSALWYDLALARVRRGETALARQAMARIVEPESVIRLRADKRFDALVDRDDPAFDVEAAAQRTIEALRAKTRQRPRSLEARSSLLSALLVAGDLQAVLDLSDELERAVAAGGENPPYDDPDRLTWVLNTRAIALRRLGRLDEAVALMERIHRNPEQGRPNVSQAINLATYECQAGHPERSLQRLDRIVDSDVSAYGRVQVAAVRLCVAVAMQDRAAQARAFRFIRKHRKASQETHLDALLLLGRVDEAAKRYIARLASEDERADALFELQDTVRAEPLPGDRTIDASRRALLARDDVRAAVERVGRIERHRIWVGYVF